MKLAPTRKSNRCPTSGYDYLMHQLQLVQLHADRNFPNLVKCLLACIFLENKFMFDWLAFETTSWHVIYVMH